MKWKLLSARAISLTLEFKIGIRRETSQRVNDKKKKTRVHNDYERIRWFTELSVCLRTRARLVMPATSPARATAIIIINTTVFFDFPRVQATFFVRSPRRVVWVLIGF